MSVRSNILALLTLGPAYGLQVHSEIESRTARPGQINVGQIYSTLTRLTDAGLVRPAHHPDETLPLYELTASGRAEAEDWLSRPSEPLSWSAMVEHVLLASSLPGREPEGLLESYRSAWTALGATAPSQENRLAAAADARLSEAAVEWVDEVARLSASGTLQATCLRSERPRRGRRPTVRT